MKTFLFILATLTFGINCFGQGSREVTKADSIRIDVEVELKALCTGILK